MSKKVITILSMFSLLFYFSISVSFAVEYPPKFSPVPEFEQVEKWYKDSKSSLKDGHLELVKDEPLYIVSYWSVRYNAYQYKFFNTKPTFHFDKEKDCYVYSGEPYYFLNTVQPESPFGSVFDTASLGNSLSIFSIDWKNRTVTVNGQGSGETSEDGKKGNLGDILKNLIDIPAKILKGLADLLKKLLDGLKELLIFLFVPKKEFFDSNYSDMQNMLSSKIGIKGISGFFGNLFSHDNVDLPVIKYQGHVFLDFNIISQYGDFIRNMIAPFLWFYFAIYNLDNIYLLIRGRKLFGKSHAGGDDV